MSEAVLQQTKELIKELSSTEKAQLVEWLGAALGSELISTNSKTTKEAPTVYATQVDKGTAVASKHNGEAYPTVHEFPNEIPWEERPWTEAEIREWMKSEPKTGAEIAAWLRANPDTGDWTAMDIPDVVEWVRQLRHQISTRWEFGE